jgi:HK97 family phage major capsid protein
MQARTTEAAGGLLAMALCNHRRQVAGRFPLVPTCRQVEDQIMTLRELREKHLAISKSLRAINDKAEAENRGLSTEEKTEWDRLIAEHSDVEDRIERAEKIEHLGGSRGADDLNREQGDRARFNERRKSHNPNDDPDRPLTGYEQCRAFNAWAMGKRSQDVQAKRWAERIGLPIEQSEVNVMLNRGEDYDGVQLPAPRSLAEAQRQREIRREIRNRQLESYESRAQAVTFTTAGIKDAAGGAGGFTVPDEMMGPFEAAMLQWGGMRQVATILTTATGSDFPMPNANDTGQVGAIVGENVQVAEQDVTFTQLVLGSYKYSSKMIRVSVELLQDSAINLPAFLGEALGTRIGRITNTHFTVGTGTSQPRGIVTAAANSGVTGGTPLKLTYPEIMTLKHSVDPAYRANATFMMHDATLLKMKTMVDSQNRPIWMPSVIAGEPATFDGTPYVINQDMPSAVSTKGLIYGDLSKYLIRDVRGITLLRLDERFADYHQVAFLAFARYDGDLRDAGTNPVKYLTLAAAT